MRRVRPVFHHFGRGEEGVEGAEVKGVEGAEMEVGGREGGQWEGG